MLQGFQHAPPPRLLLYSLLTVARSNLASRLPSSSLAASLVFRKPEPAPAHDRRELATVLMLILALALMFALGWLAHDFYPSATGNAMRLADLLEQQQQQQQLDLEPAVRRVPRLRLAPAPLPIDRIWQQVLVRV